MVEQPASNASKWLAAAACSGTGTAASTDMALVVQDDGCQKADEVPKAVLRKLRRHIVKRRIRGSRSDSCSWPMLEERYIDMLAGRDAQIKTQVDMLADRDAQIKTLMDMLASFQAQINILEGERSQWKARWRKLAAWWALAPRHLSSFSGTDPSSSD
jgi:hypothetical protein